MSRNRKHQPRVPLGIGIGLCLALVTILINLQGSAPEAARAARSTGLSTQTNNASADWTIGPSFAGKVLHWTQTNYNYTPNGPDPANGKAVNADIWVVVGSDGLPLVDLARFTLSDGTFLQELLLTRQTATSLFSSAYRMPGGCIVDNKVSSTKDLLSALPQFVQESLLPAQNYIKVSKRLSYPQPVTPSLVKVTPVRIYSSGTSVHSWFFSATLSTGMKHSYALDINTDGRLLASEVKLFDAQGALIQDSWTTYGQLQVYNSSDVPGIISALTQKDEKCR